MCQQIFRCSGQVGLYLYITVFYVVVKSSRETWVCDSWYINQIAPVVSNPFAVGVADRWLTGFLIWSNVTGIGRRWDDN